VFVFVRVQESYKEGNVVKLVDVPTAPEPISARKTLFEAGEAWNQNSARAVSSKVHMVISFFLDLFLSPHTMKVTKDVVLDSSDCRCLDIYFYIYVPQKTVIQV